MHFRFFLKGSSLLLLSLACVLLVGNASLVHAQGTRSRFQAACIRPTLAFYPGSTLARFRYGEVDFNFVVCQETPPYAWTASNTRATTNATGENLGFFITGASIHPTNSNAFSATFEGDIYWKTCTPRVGWPCRASGAFTIIFGATENPSLSVWVEQIKAPLGLTLYRTP